jgi:hypothetical protein
MYNFNASDLLKTAVFLAALHAVGYHFVMWSHWTFNSKASEKLLGFMPLLSRKLHNVLHRKLEMGMIIPLLATNS